MKKEDLLDAIARQTWLSKKAAGKVMHAVFAERERLFINRSLEVKTSPIHGRGVFATRNIPAHTILEECHFVQLKETDFKSIDPALQDYVFALKKAPDSSLTAYAIVLGISSIMNHSHDRANATWAVNSSRRLFVFKSLKPIRSGEEVLIDYDNA